MSVRESLDPDRSLWDLIATELRRQRELHKISGSRLGALEQPVGDAGTMRAQFARLLEVGDLPNVSIRVLEKGAGAHAGLDQQGSTGSVTSQRPWVHRGH